jgi:hypothetical protein
LILKENSNITEEWLVDRHEQFICFISSPDAQISERDFIDEFKTLFPKYVC